MLIYLDKMLQLTKATGDSLRIVENKMQIECEKLGAAHQGSNPENLKEIIATCYRTIYAIEEILTSNEKITLDIIHLVETAGHTDVDRTTYNDNTDDEFNPFLEALNCDTCCDEERYDNYRQ